MSTDDWYRNTDWSETIASQFEAKLRRARRKEQYIRIQACMLATSRPDVAHFLLDRYFEMQDDFDHAQAHVDRATAYLSEGKIEETIASYEAAIKREAEFPNLRTQAYVELPYLVAVRGTVNHYARAVEVLDAHQERLMFAIDHFKWNAAQAIIAHALGNPTAAKLYAAAALSAAERDNSGFRYHPTVGLVQNNYSEIQTLLRRLCDA